MKLVNYIDFDSLENLNQFIWDSNHKLYSEKITNIINVETIEIEHKWTDELNGPQFEIKEQFRLWYQ